MIESCVVLRAVRCVPCAACRALRAVRCDAWCDAHRTCKQRKP